MSDRIAALGSFDDSSKEFFTLEKQWMPEPIDALCLSVIILIIWMVWGPMIVWFKRVTRRSKFRLDTSPRENPEAQIHIGGHDIGRGNAFSIIPSAPNRYHLKLRVALDTYFTDSDHSGNAWEFHCLEDNSQAVVLRHILTGDIACAHGQRVYLVPEADLGRLGPIATPFITITSKYEGGARKWDSIPLPQPSRCERIKDRVLGGIFGCIFSFVPIPMPRVPS